MEYCLTSQIDLCFTYTSQIIAYIKKVHPNILLQNNILPYTYLVHCRTLYRQNLFRQILEFTRNVNMSLIKYNISAYSGYLFFYSQALGECSSHDEAHSNAINAYALSEIREYYKNSVALKKYFNEDFSIILNY